MEAVIFCGIQASGKTTFYKEYFFKTHIRIALDLLHTRNKEQIFLNTCFHTRQRFVVDNTNPTKAVRRTYIEQAKTHKFKVTGYYFQPNVEEALLRNKGRKGKEHIPIAGIRGTYKKLEALTYEEGFDQLFYVDIVDNSFVINEQQKKER